ncbi:restriction endonuclease [Microcoleus sp. FACHB-1515]|uniref:restriction endonuclease n=1 Tax=Cyanophyceae TaxID=3028117 RepID=UPI001682C4D0|nr:restriction endonuclease [Microcoleus sp. FACHB-1515]MBD2089515.1 restriction endonuclease [Microcoleus sp. FACHB-1515]
MTVLDFKEIPRANQSNGEQDAFELFARDFLLMAGYSIKRGPDRGQDAGRDLIAVETRKGVGGETIVRWLVSCKHKAHSGNSTVLSDEPDILERVQSHDCCGFIGFYSTLPASSLTNRLKGLEENRGLHYQIFDRASIESQLLSSLEGLTLAERYFPNSIKTWRRENPQPANLFEIDETLTCEACGKPLLEPPEGIVGFGFNFIQVNGQTRERYEDIYWCCRGACDRELRRRFRSQNLMDGWRDLSDLCIPSAYLKFTNSIIFQLQTGTQYSEQYHKKLEHLVIQLFPHISRELTSREREKIEELDGLDVLFGGLF